MLETYPNALSWFGAIVSVIGTGITIYQVSKAKTIKEEIIIESKKMIYQNIIEELKKAQPYIRQLVNQERGTSFKMISDNIHSSFDNTISSLDETDDKEEKLRTLIKDAQANLNEFISKRTKTYIQECQSQVQDGLSKCNKLLKGMK